MHLVAEAFQKTQHMFSIDLSREVVNGHVYCAWAGQFLKGICDCNMKHTRQWLEISALVRTADMAKACRFKNQAEAYSLAARIGHVLRPVVTISC